MRISEIHLLAKAMMAELFVKLGPNTGIKGLGVQIEWRFKLDQDGRCCRRKLKIELAAFQDTFGGTDEEDGVTPAFSKNLGSPVQTRILLTVDGNAGHQLQQVEIIPAIDWHLLNLRGYDSGA